MKLRYASGEDIPLLAELSHQLIQDESAPNQMSVSELAEQMRGWISGDYRAIVFELEEKPVAYALFRSSEDGIYLRQFFVSRAHRRQGIGRQAIKAFREQVVPPDQVLSLEVFVHNEAGISFWRAVGFEEHTISLRIDPRQSAV